MAQLDMRMHPPINRYSEWQNWRDTCFPEIQGSVHGKGDS